MIRRITAAAVLACGMTVASPFAAQAQALLDIGRIILGLPTEQKEPIDYRERAPLVVPPGQNLRPPLEAAPAEQRRANWPQDPDVVARRKAAENARRPVMLDSVTGRELAPTRRMTLDEIRAGRVAGAEVPTTPQLMINDRERQNVFGGLATLREMDQKEAAANRAAGGANPVEPRREFLTDPPEGLRRPSEAAAFRATREGRVGAREDPKPYDIYREGPNTR